MRDDIVEKLRQELANGIQTEAQVVYLLVELRKLIEQSEEQDRYLSVLFFCDWAVHVQMDRKSALHLLQELDSAMSRATTKGELGELIGRILSMDRFRDELIHALMHFGLPTDPVRTMAGWLSFLPLYLNVITDCPVLKRNVNLQHINHLVVQVQRDDPPKDIPERALFGFAIRWTFLKDGEIVLEWRNDVLYPKDHKPGVFYTLN